MRKNQPENKPTQWEIGQPSDVYFENPVKIKIPLGLLHSGVLGIGHHEKIAITYC